MMRPAIDAEEAELDAQHRDLFIAWAKQANDEDPPSPPSRDEIARRRTVAAGNLRSATIARQAVEGRRMELGAALRRISDQVFSVRLEELARGGACAA